MAMAHKAPFSGTKMHFGITDTAIKSMRELATEFVSNAYRTDQDLEHALDEYAWDSYQSGKFEKILDDGRASLIIDMRGRLKDMWALVRDNNLVAKGAMPQTIITVLTTEMVANSKTHGRWSPLAAAPGQKMVELKDKLAAKVVSMIQEASGQGPAPAPAAPSVAAASPIVRKKDPPEFEVHWYVDADDVLRKQSGFHSREAVKVFMGKLIDEDFVDRAEIKCYRVEMVRTLIEMPTRVSIELV